MKAYADWTRKFQSYLKNKPTEALSPAEVKEYLTYLAVTCKVSSSHQNQAFNALLFLYQHVLGRELEWLGNLVHAKRPVHVSVVLGRAEARNLLAHVQGPVRLPPTCWKTATISAPSRNLSLIHI